MDPKAAAKSKRSHTVHGRRPHQTPAAAAARKQKRGAGSSSAPRGRDLPSNWDRYDSDGEADPAGAAGWAGEVAPQSKGADFEFLLEQARAAPRETRSLSAPWLPSQDSSFDFMQTSTSMLEAKGEGILSWRDDDNFILEDDLAPEFEVPFLSMDLLALANQLSKIKLSQRLFIEGDILPHELADESEILIECGISVENDSEGSLVQHNQTKREQPSSQCSEQKSTTPGEGNERCTRVIDTAPDTSHSEGLKFEVDAAEKELDMLLNSISGTHLSSSNLDELYGHGSTLHGMKSSESNEKVTLNMSSKSPALAPVDDDALDDFLSETYVSVQNGCLPTPNLASQPTFQSGHNIDSSYAKKTDVTTSIDDSMDDLLGDTLLCLNEQKQTTSAQGQNSTSNDSAPPHSGSSKVSDDFDSWFDSL